VKVPAGVIADAMLDGPYRYLLIRRWAAGPRAVWVMLNPSTATADEDDATIRRCQAFARTWRLNAIAVVNLFGLRSTDPGRLRTHPDPVGPRNDQVIETVACGGDTAIVVAGWGNHGSLFGRAETVRKLLAGAGVPLYHLGLTGAGEPRHPLYVRGDTVPVRWA
jgi:hypothetical protein